MIAADLVFFEANRLLRTGKVAGALEALADIDSFVDDEDEHSWNGRKQEAYELAKELAWQAEQLIRDGLIDDAIRRIECFTHPRWGSEQHCQEEYEGTMKEMNQ